MHPGVQYQHVASPLIAGGTYREERRATVKLSSKQLFCTLKHSSSVELCERPQMHE